MARPGCRFDQHGPVFAAVPDAHPHLAGQAGEPGRERVAGRVHISSGRPGRPPSSTPAWPARANASAWSWVMYMVVAAAWRTSAGHVKGCGEHTAELLAEAPASTAVEQRATLIISRR